MVRYIKYSIPDGILCLLMAVGLSMNVYQGFLLPAGLSAAVLRSACVSGIFLIFLFWAAYSKRTTLIGVFVLIAFAVLAVVILAAMGIPLIETEDEEANAALWYMLTLLVTLGIFLLSRGFAGSLIIIAGGIFLHGLLAAMLYKFYIPALVVFLAASLVSCLFKRYWKNVLETDTRRAAFFPMLGYAGGLTGAALGLACAVWFGVLANFTLPVLDIQLITNIVSIELLEVMGISQELEIMDQDLYSTEVNEDEQKESSQTGEDNENIPEQEQQNEEEQTGEEDSITIEDESGSTATTAVNYLNDFLDMLLGSVLFWILIAAAVVIVILLIAFRRRIWWERMKKLPPKKRVAYLYSWTLVRLVRMKYPERGSRTPDEYAELIGDKMRFLNTKTVMWKDITALMVQVCYADVSPDAEQEKLLENYYTNFHKNCRKHFGWRYIFWYFRL